jgi:L-iditol 2-dehydrogenase
VLFFAVPPPGDDVYVPIADFWRNEITIMTSYGAAPNDIEESLEMLSFNRIKPHEMITHRLPLAETGLGFQLVAEARQSLKVVIEPQR